MCSAARYPCGCCRTLLGDVVLLAGAVCRVSRSVCRSTEVMSSPLILTVRVREQAVDLFLR
jgi:hypothetical protein